ncbi:MAG: proton-conducting transporter membrane subunit [Methanosarcinales archaeon Met12]|nr:MAG: proton-conducting transporter membrane subunit [Methanosarcinales archaeon Met12]
MTEKVVEMTSVVTSVIPAWAVLFPLVGALLVYIAGRKSEKVRDILAVAITTITFGLVVSMHPIVSAGSTIEYTIPSFLYGLNFYVDGTGLLLAVVTSFIWMIATLYSVGPGYMSHEHARNRFYVFMLLTLGANLGVLLTGDLFSLFIFFEMMALTSYVLVIHTETPEAMKAGRKFLFLSVIGGLFLLMGIFLIYHFTGTLMISPLMQEMAGLGWLKYLIAALMVIGFGVKAGIVPLHVWLPEAHPVAPSPASALLSGVMIKAGAYGILRTVGMIFTPANDVVAYATEHAPVLWSTTQAIGYGVIWIGIITMFIGVCLALIQENSKRMLAYLSISSMGFIVMGIGCAAYLGYEGAMGFAGATSYILSHALFKALLFLAVGAVYFRTHELNMYKLGGLWRNMPITAICCFIAVMGISGIPGFNGYASKVLLYYSIVEAYELHGDGLLYLAPIIFKVTSAGVICAAMKMFIFTFLGKRSEKYKDVKPVPLSMQVAMLAMAAMILLIGIRPDLMMQMFITPAMGVYTYSAYNVEYIAKYGYDAAKFFTLTSIQGVGGKMLMAGVIFIVGIRAGWFHLQPPLWIGPNYWYEKTASSFVWFCKNPVSTFATYVDMAFAKIVTGLIWACKCTYAMVVYGIDRLSMAAEKASRRAKERAERIERGDTTVDVRSIDFAIFLIAVMLSIFLVYMALVHLLGVS